MKVVKIGARSFNKYGSSRLCWRPGRCQRVLFLSHGTLAMTHTVTAILCSKVCEHKTDYFKLIRLWTRIRYQRKCQKDRSLDSFPPDDPSFKLTESTRTTPLLIVDILASLKLKYCLLGKDLCKLIDFLFQFSMDIMTGSAVAKPFGSHLATVSKYM